jgi:predicted permease
MSRGERVTAAQESVPGGSTIRWLARLVPSYRRREWTNEWESELGHTRAELEEAGSSHAMAMLRLRLRAWGAVRDALWVRNRNGGSSGTGRDLKHAARLLRRQPGFSAMVVITLGLGIGATTAIFSAIDGLLLRSPPFADPEELVEVSVSSPDGFFRYLDWETADVWRSQTGVFAAAHTHTMRSLTLTRPGEPTRLLAFLIQPGYLEMLGIRPVLGRSFAEDESVPGRDRVVLLSDEAWRGSFGRDPGIVGSTVYLDDEPYTVIGVLPPTLRRLPGGIPQLLLPLPNAATEATRSLFLTARLRDDLPLPVAQARLDDVTVRLESEQPREAGWGVRIDRLTRVVDQKTRRGLHALAGAVTLLLVVACINAAGLLFVRGVAQRGELTVRAALGGTRAALFRQSLAESLVLSLAAGVAGSLLAFWGVRVLTALAPPSLLRFSYNAVGVDARVLGFALVLSIATGIGFGVAPALRAARASAGLPGQRNATTGRGEMRVRSVVQATQIALAVILLTGAGLFGRSFLRLMAVDPGFDPDGLLIVQYGLPSFRYDAAQRSTFQFAIEDRLRALPGVTGVSFATDVPPSVGIMFGRTPEADGGTTVSDMEFLPFSSVDTSYFRVMGIDLVQGRAFDASDLSQGTSSVIVDVDLARALWPDGSAAGRRFRLGADEEWLTVVGVSEDVKLEGPDDADHPHALFYPTSASRMSGATVAIRADGASTALIEPVRNVIHSLDPVLPIGEIEPAESRFAEAIDQPRFVLVMMGAFAAVALVLVAVGIYGLVSFMVVRRTREIGIRKAIGADDGQILGAVLGRGVVIALAGLAGGVVGALFLSRYIARLLFEVPAVDPVTLAAVSGVLLLSCTLALMLPARRAARVAAAEAIRLE